jgi:hypothetical protein
MYAKVETTATTEWSGRMRKRETRKRKREREKGKRK